MFLSLLHYSEEIQVKPNEDETFNWDLTVKFRLFQLVLLMSSTWSAKFDIM